MFCRDSCMATSAGQMVSSMRLMLFFDFGEQRDEFGIAPAALRFFEHDFERVGVGERRLIGTRGGEGVIDVGDLQNARQQRNPFAAEAVGIAGAIPPLVMAADDGQHRRQGLHGPANFLAADGVHAHDLPLVGTEHAVLEEDGVGDADLADVVQIAAAIERQLIRFGNSHAPGPGGRCRRPGARNAFRYSCRALPPISPGRTEWSRLRPANR